MTFQPLLHGLRHKHTAMLINSGANIKLVTSRLGHSKTSSALDVYSHVIKKADREIADQLNNVFDNARKESRKN